MARQELHTGDVKVQQRPDITNQEDFEGDIIHAHQLPKDDYAQELLFNDEPMTIRLEPGSDRNAPLHHPVWINGVGAEIFLRGRWYQATYLPVGVPLITKRKYVAQLAGAKQDAVQTIVREKQDENPTNDVRRTTSRAANFSVIEDKNPKGAAWLTELLNRA